MAFIEGATLEESRGWVAASNYTKPTSGQGATVGGHDVGTKSQANVNSGVVAFGATVGVYAPQLSILFGTDDF
jgi:hypothetical protein